ncbi:MAG: RNA-directed DNA polymerase [Culturomica sp.]|jgi:retron-type reverse transcriptase|nr:RNA-directed DNA polymerase [Culturomica sp.]
MKRENHLLERIADPENLRLAFWKARRGKDARKEVANYRRDLDKNLLLLRNQILSGTVDVGHYHFFKIYDPKERQICAAPFPERVLHHAIMNVCHDVFERYQIFDSYACRLGKGTFAALNRAHHFHRCYRWFLKLDVRKYFDNIDHNILKTMLARCFKEHLLLKIFYSIIDSYHTQTGKGLPIGNLTSQYFANHYLGAADHYLKESLHVKAYVRYMDDMVVWTDDKSHLLSLGRRLQAFLSDSLHLTLKPFCLNAVQRGLPFLGYVLLPAVIRLQRRSQQRFRSKYKLYTALLRSGAWSQELYQSHILPLFSFTFHADALKWRSVVVVG